MLVTDPPMIEPATGGFLSRRLDRSTVVVAAIALFYVCMTVYAVVVFKQFSPGQVIVVGVLFALILAALGAAFLVPRLRAVRMRPTLLSLVVAVIGCAVLIALAFTWRTTVDPVWPPYYPAFPIEALARGAGFHQDAVFHVSLIQSIVSFGYPSTGQNGVPFVPYHVLSHYMDALVLMISGLEPYDSYGLLFHFKVAVFVVAIVTFVWLVTCAGGPARFVLMTIIAVPLLVSTWISVGSHSLWLTTLILVTSAPLVFDTVRAARTSPGRYAAIFAIGAAVGLGKVSSGLMFAVLVGVLLVLRDYRRPAPYLLIVAWVGFFAVYYRLFNTGHSSGVQRPSVSGTVRFLNPFWTYGGNPVELNLVALYAIALIALGLGIVYRSAISRRLALATTAGILAVAAVTQVLVGLTQPDIFYFILGLLVPALLLAIQTVGTEVGGEVAAPAALRRLPSRAVAIGLVVVIALSTLAMYRGPLNLFALPVAPVQASIASAESGYFDDLNLGRAPSDSVTFSGVLSGADRVRVPGADRIRETRASLDRFMNDNGLSPRDTVLYVPAEIFDTEIASFGGPSWARGMLVYAVLGVPLIHGLQDESIRNFGQSSYNSDALHVSIEDFDEAAECAAGKQIIVVAQLQPARFSLACD